MVRESTTVHPDFRTGKVSTSAMWIEPSDDHSKLVREAKKPESWEQYSRIHGGTDQEWLGNLWRKHPPQFYPPWMVQSYKAMIGKFKEHEDAVPDRNPILVQFHGTPKPHESRFMQALALWP